MKLPRPKSKGEETLALALRATRYHFVREYRWCPSREFRADFAVWHTEAEQLAGNLPLLVEIDGAKRGKPGAHQRVDGVDYDCRRMAEAMCLGYRMLRVSWRMIKDATVLGYIERLLLRPSTQ